MAKQDGEGDDVLDNLLSKTRSEVILFRAEWGALVDRSFEKRLAPMPEVREDGDDLQEAQ